MRAYSRLFALDLRSLAVARILAGLVLAGDALVRWPFADVFYSEQGVSPRRLLLESYQSLRLPLPSVANDLLIYQYGLLSALFLSGAALFLGYRTRTVTVVSWLLLLSVQQRNELILNSGDTLLVALLFWGIFLPWGERWSLDARRESPSSAGEATTVLSAATIGWCMQMMCVYLFAALHKLNPYWTTEGSAVFHSLSLGHHATAWAPLLLNFPTLLPLLTRSVLVMEFVLAFAIVVPWARTRAVVLVMAGLMHLVFGLFLEIGIFRYTPLMGLAALWRFPDHQRSPELDETRNWRSLPLLGICILTWAINFESLGKARGGVLPEKLTNFALTISLPQYWGVFAGPSLERDGWFCVEVRAKDGRQYDAWRHDLPLSLDRPTLVSATYPDDRWRKWMLNLPALPSDNPHRLRFAQWSMEQWNLRHPDNPAEYVRVWNAVVTTSPLRPPTAPVWNLIAEARS